MLVKNTFTHDARVEREAQSLIASGNRVSVVALLAGNLPEFELNNEVGIFRVRRPFTNLRSLGDPSAILKTESRLKADIKRLILHVARIASTLKIADPIHRSLDKLFIEKALTLKPDVVHSHDLDTFRAGSIVSASLGIPLVYDSHEMATARSLGNIRTNYRAHKLESSLIMKAELVLMASQGYADRAVELYGIKPPTVIRNIPRYRTEFNPNLDLRSHFQIPANHTILVYQGSLQPYRGVEQLIDAVSYIDNVSLVIIGYGSHLLYLEKKVSCSAASDRIHFLGAVPKEHLIDWASTADIGICTIVGKSDSYRHSMPNKLFEYTMSGIAIIASDYPGMGGFVSKHKLGEVCDPESEQEIVQAISRLISDRRYLEKCKSNARLTREIVNWEAEELALQSAYSNLLMQSGD